MIGLDTNILARYYIEDAADAQYRRQREVARRLIESGEPLMVCKTALLELEWVMRGYYGFSAGRIADAFNHLLSLSHVQVEARDDVIAAVAHYVKGLDFADALHHASYHACRTMASFDDRRFARRAKRLGLTPGVIIPS